MLSKFVRTYPAPLCSLIAVMTKHPVLCWIVMFYSAPISRVGAAFMDSVDSFYVIQAKKFVNTLFATLATFSIHIEKRLFQGVELRAVAITRLLFFDNLFSVLLVMFSGPLFFLTWILPVKLSFTLSYCIPFFLRKVNPISAAQFFFPLTIALGPSSMILAPMRFNSLTCMNRSG